jgi:hypothetical protein
VWSYRDFPGRPRNVASQPAPKRLHCGRTPNSKSFFFGLNPERDLRIAAIRIIASSAQDGAGARPHRCVPAPEPTGTGIFGHSRLILDIDGDVLPRGRRARRPPSAVGAIVHIPEVDQHDELDGFARRAHPPGGRAAAPPASRP